MANTRHISYAVEPRTPSAVTPAKAGAYTRWFVGVSAGGGAGNRTSVRMGPGVDLWSTSSRRGDVVFGECVR